jgi:hypothetical protein
MKKISFNKRISMKCLGCVGGSRKEVTLCHLFDCPLWAYRTGSTIRSTKYKKRMQTARDRYKKEFEELERMGITFEDFFVERGINVFPEET